MSRILDYVLEPNVVYTNGAFLIKVKVQDDYKYKKYLVSESMKYITATGTTFTLTNAVSTNNSSILQLQGNTTQNGTPTPSSPIEVSTVSGDNEVVVCGKNKLDISKWVKGRINNTSGNIEYANNVSSMTISENTITFTVSQAWNSGIASEFIPVTQGTYTYTYSHNREISMYIDAYNSNKTKISRLVSYTQSTTPTTRTFTISDSNVKYIRIHFEVNTANVSYEVSNMQLEKGSQATTYQAYTGNSYRVDLGGKNEFHDYYQITDTTNGITRTLTDNGIKLNGTYNKNANMDLWLTKSTSAGYSNNMTLLKANTQYTISIRAISGSFSTSGITCRISARTVTEKTFTWNYQTPILTNNEWRLTFTPTADIYVGGIRFYLSTSNTAVFNNAELGIQIEKGSVVTPFSPYVSNPIELCKIGSYVDKLKRSTGTNLAEFDNTQDTTKYTYTSFKSSDITVNKTATGGSFYASFTLHIPKAGTYILSGNNISSNQMYIYTDTLWGTLKESFTPTRDSNGNFVRETNFTTAGNYIIGLYGSATGNYSTKNFMCTETEQTTYEPYGVNTWYIEKNIGKVVLNGSESGWTGGSVATNVYRFYKTIEGIRAYTDSNRHIDRFITDRFKLSTSNEYGASYQYQNSLYFCVSSNEATTVDSFKTWLSNNNTTVYYQLATPTYEVITNENLIEQLNNIQDIGLIENLCYVDWVGEESPTMLLQYPTNETLNAYLITEDNKLIRTDWRFIGRRK